MHSYSVSLVAGIRTRKLEGEESLEDITGPKFTAYKCLVIRLYINSGPS